MIPLPVKCSDFKKIITTRIKKITEKDPKPVKLTQGEIYEIALKVAGLTMTDEVKESQCTPFQKLDRTFVPIELIYENFQNEWWFPQLANTWLPLKYKDYPKLAQFWKHEHIGELRIQQLQKLVYGLKNNAFEYFLPEYSDTRLPVLQEHHVSLLKQLFNVDMSAQELKIIHLYCKICTLVEKSKNLEIKPSDLFEMEDAHLSKNDLTVLIRMISLDCKKLRQIGEKRYPLLVIDRNPSEDGPPFFYYRRSDYTSLVRMKQCISDIISRSVDYAEKKPKGFSKINEDLPDEEQDKAVKTITEEQNILLVHGPPGTGKSFVGGRISRYYKKIVCVAPTAEIADRMHENYNGECMTIDMCLERMRHGTKKGRLLMEMEVLIIDEVGMLPLQKFADLLRLLKKLGKLALLGDIDQCRPIGGGPIIDILLDAWKDTEYLFKLKKNWRVATKNGVIVTNFEAFNEGRLGDMQYSSDVHDLQHICHFVQRQFYPSKLLYNVNTVTTQNELVSYMKKEFAPIRERYIKRGIDMTSVRVLVLRKDYRLYINRAWWELDNPGSKTGYRDTVFYPGSYITFNENFNGKRFRGRPSHLGTSMLKHNGTAMILEIYDIDPTLTKREAQARRRVLSSTSEERTNSNWHRIIQLSGNRQINLSDYPIKDICYAYASTIHSAIGAECKAVCIWIHPNFVNIFRDTLYTAISRPKEEIDIVFDLEGDPMLYNSEIGRIWRNLSMKPVNSLARFIPLNRENREELHVAEETPFEGLGRLIEEESDTSSEEEGWQFSENEGEFLNDSQTIFRDTSVPTPTLVTNMSSNSQGPIFLTDTQ
jgi:hypothetical protein